MWSRSIARILHHGSFSTPLPLVKDGDFIAIVQHLILAKGPETVRITKVNGHATDADVEQGRVRAADAAADLGRRHQTEEAMDVQRALINAGGL